MLKPQKEFYTPEEYFALEEAAEYKSEYSQGEIFAMAGGTPNHDRIAGNLYVNFHSKLNGTLCEPFTSDMRIQIDEKKHYAYPDLSVVCGELEFAEGRKDMISNPIVIVEVLSKSTRNYDRSFKFSDYRNIKTFRDYILVEQDEVHIENFHKNEDGFWILYEYKNLDETLVIKSINVEIPVKEIYARVKW